jgi:SAM-dependent methyltransferase
MGAAAQRWRDALAEWAIPDEILVAAPRSPWSLPTQVFARRADASVLRPDGASYRRAAEVPGTVLDVGCGAGAAGLPLGRPIVGVDSSTQMLAAFTERANRLGLEASTVEGRWPDVADRTPPADVVVCHHVVYNAPDLDAFAAALTDHARRRVVLELTPRHPMSALNPLWTRLQGVIRPERPTWEDARDVLTELGLHPTAETSPRQGRTEYAGLDDLVEVTRVRLCLPPERDGELREALLDLGVDPEHPRDLSVDEVVTLWWDV